MVLELIGLVVILSGLAGYYGIAFFSKSLWRAVTYSFLWGIAIYLLLGTLGGAAPFGFDVLSGCSALHQIGTIKLGAGAHFSSVFAGLVVCFVLNQIVAIILRVVIYVERKIYDQA